MEHKLNRGMPGMAGMPGMSMLPPQAPYFLMIPGLLLIGFGVLVIFNEQLVKWLVAGVFLILGLLLLLAGTRMKRMVG
ncbi:MAG: hypothetical protein IPK26_14045 [Planctomycetes bacterium]|nr:hypothetical protein [Planctomycetota bacterium]